MKTLLNSIDVSYSEKIFESEEGIAGLGADPFDTGDRIFIIAMYSNHARPLLCEVGGAGCSCGWSLWATAKELCGFKLSLVPSLRFQLSFCLS